MSRLGIFAALIALSTTARADLPLPVLYTLYCSGCHGGDGKGVPEKGIPDLNDAGRYVAIASGRRYLIEVPGISQSVLNDEKAAQLLNYVLQRFAANRLPADFKAYTASEVTQYRGNTASDAPVRRQAIVTQLRAQGLLPKDYP